MKPSLQIDPTRRPPQRPDPRCRPLRIGIAWLAVACWIAVIWTLGGDDFSARDTNSVVLRFFRALFGEFDVRLYYRILIGVRKSAHFIEYAILALLTFRAARISARRNQWASAAWLALFIVATIASADEARQAFSEVRTGSPYDAVLDLTAGIIAIVGVLWITRRIRSNTSEARSAPAQKAPQLP